jgi:hypothetical protein
MYIMRSSRVCSCEQISLGWWEIEEHETGWTCSMHDEMRKAYKILFRHPQGRRPLRRFKHGLEDNTKIDLMEVVFGV